jgi:hypothetical protein
VAYGTLTVLLPHFPALQCGAPLRITALQIAELLRELASKRPKNLPIAARQPLHLRESGCKERLEKLFSLFSSELWVRHTPNETQINRSRMSRQMH